MNLIKIYRFVTLITVLQKKIQYYACNSMIDVFSSGLIIMDFKPNIIGDLLWHTIQQNRSVLKWLNQFQSYQKQNVKKR